MVQVGDLVKIRSKRKATTALFSYVVRQEQEGGGGMMDVFLRVVKLRLFTIGPQITTLFGKGNSDSLNRVITLVSPYAPWESREFHSDTVIRRWAAAASAVPYTEEVGRCIVDALLQISSFNFLQPHIPADVWGLLKKRPPLPPFCVGRFLGTTGCVVRRVRELGDVEILKSYLLLVWSEWDVVHSEGFTDMCVLIRDDFGGIWMGGHWGELIGRLDHVLGRLDQGFGSSLQPHRIKKQYEELKEILLEVDKEATEILTRTPS